MSGGPCCTCTPKDRSQWKVIDRNCNYSAFSGYAWTYSEYSSVTCQKCKNVWRTKARYVEELPIMTDEERKRWRYGQ